MRVTTITNLYNLFKEYDENTMLRPKNIRKLITDNNFSYHKVGEYSLIDYDDFIKKINPKNINKNYNIPKIRNIQSATREYNATHKHKISYHKIEYCIKHNKIAFVKTKRLYFINYNEFENYMEKSRFEKRVKEI